MIPTTRELSCFSKQKLGTLLLLIISKSKQYFRVKQSFNLLGLFNPLLYRAIISPVPSNFYQKVKNWIQEETKLK